MAFGTEQPIGAKPGRNKGLLGPDHNPHTRVFDDLEAKQAELRTRHLMNGQPVAAFFSDLGAERGVGGIRTAVNDKRDGQGWRLASMNYSQRNANDSLVAQTAAVESTLGAVGSAVRLLFTKKEQRPKGAIGKELLKAAQGKR